MAVSVDFRGALANWASGVSVVTSASGGMLYGLTVSSFSSLSLDPPLVLVCLNNTNRMASMIEESGYFAVSILAQGQEKAASYFARTGRMPTPDFVEVEGEYAATGQPVVKGALAYLVCRLFQAIEQGDHTIVIGEVIEAVSRNDGEPLIYWRRSFREIGSAPG